MSKVIKARDLTIGGNPFVIAGDPSGDTNAVDGAMAESELAASWQEDRERWLADLEEAEGAEAEEARGLLAEAKREAARLLDEAAERARALEEEVVVLREQAGAEGYAEGVERGRAEGRDEGLAAARATMADAVARATGFLEECMAARGRILAGSRDEVLKIVKKCAEKIVRASVGLDTEVVQRAIGAALELVAEKSRLLVRVNPVDVAKAREAEAHFLQFLPSSTQLEVLGDTAVQPGGCFIESSAGSVDARVETQLEEILLQLEGAVHAG